jgi:hypothetical protein
MGFGAIRDLRDFDWGSSGDLKGLLRSGYKGLNIGDGEHIEL